MPCDNEDNVLSGLLQLLTSGEDNRFRDDLAVLLNAAMLLERQNHLRAPHQRTEQRDCYANSFKDKSFVSRLGEIDVCVPQVRGSSERFYPQILGKGLWSERALKLALVEMYVPGVSTRKVAAITEKLCGFEVTSTQVNRAAAELDGVLEAWRDRPLGEIAYLILDARHRVRQRHGGIVQSATVLIAVGVGLDGKRQIIGVSVALSEQEAHWQQFSKSLMERGLSGVRLIVSDDHSGLKAARQAVFGSVPWQRCHSICSRTLRHMFPSRRSRRRSPLTFARSSRQPAGRQRTYCSERW